MVLLSPKFPSVLRQVHVGFCLLEDRETSVPTSFLLKAAEGGVERN